MPLCGGVSVSDYTYDINFEERVRSLRQSATGMPIELQLVWVAELLCIWLLLKNRDSSNKVIHLDKAWRLTHRSATMLANTAGLGFRTVAILFDFRDAFVHEGLLSAVPYQLQLLSRPQQEFDTLQKVVGVKLNPGRSLL